MMKLIKLWEADIVKAHDLFGSFLENDHGFSNIAYGLNIDDFKELVKLKEANSRGEMLQEGFVPDTIYILVDDEENYVGVYSLRHELNSFLKEGPGHIGYVIRKKYRGRGYSKVGLKLLTDLKNIKEDEYYLSCYKDNDRSLKCQLACGAIIDHEDDDYYYTRIKK